MKKVLITSISEVNKEKARIDGKASRDFVTVGYVEALQRPDGSYYANPFVAVSKNLFQRHSSDGKTAKWGHQSPEALKELMNNQDPIPADIVTEEVEKFAVMGPDGKQQTRKDGTLVFANKYTTIVFPNENVEDVFAAANHPIVGKRSTATSTKKAETELQA